MKYLTVSFCFILFLFSCKEEEITSEPVPVIEDYSISINYNLLNYQRYIGYFISNHQGEIYQYELTNGQLLQQDIVFNMEKSSDEAIAVTLIEEKFYIDRPPDISFVELTTFVDLPNGAYIEDNPYYLFGWSNGNKNIELSDIEEFDLLLFPQQSGSWEVERVSSIENTLFAELRIPTTFENFILVKANGDEKFRYITFKDGETLVKASYSDLPYAAEIEIYMPSYGNWNGYIFGISAETGNKMLLHGEVENESNSGLNNGRTYKVYFPAEIEFSKFDFYLDNGYGNNDAIIAQSFDELPTSILPNDQIGVVEKLIDEDGYKIKITESTDFYEMRYYRNTSDSDINWDIIGYADSSVIEFKLPDIPEELLLEFPADLILNRRFEYAFLYLFNIQSDFAADFWQLPHQVREFDWKIDNGIYGTYMYYRL